MVETIKKALNTVFGWFKSDKWKKAEIIAAQIGALLPYAEQAVTIVAQLSGNKTAAKVKEVLTTLRVPESEVPFDVTKVYSKTELSAMLMAAAAHALRGELNKAIIESAGVGINIAGKTIKTGQEVPDNIINSAINTVYSFVKGNIEG